MPLHGMWIRLGDLRQADWAVGQQVARAMAIMPFSVTVGLLVRMNDSLRVLYYLTNHQPGGKMYTLSLAHVQDIVFTTKALGSRYGLTQSRSCVVKDAAIKSRWGACPHFLQPIHSSVNSAGGGDHSARGSLGMDTHTHHILGRKEILLQIHA